MVCVMHMVCSGCGGGGGDVVTRGMCGECGVCVWVCVCKGAVAVLAAPKVARS